MMRRRTFLKAATNLPALLFAAPAIAKEKSPNSKLQLACIGIGGRGADNIAEMTKETGGLAECPKYLAFCDVNSNTLAKQSDAYKVEHRYADFRELLYKHNRELDAVFIGTLDHTHGIIACDAMSCGLHCYCEKPLANSAWEVRQMAAWAAKKKLVTQTGTQVRSWDSAHYYRGIEMVRSGVIGEIQEVHIWCAGTYVPKTEPAGEDPVPKELNYDLWVGPQKFLPYNKLWLSFSKYGFWHSGHGWLGGMGPHTIDLAWTALNLGSPTVIETDGPTPPSIWYNRDEQHVTFSHFKKPAAVSSQLGAAPLVSANVKVHWYDGQRRPDALPEGWVDPKPSAGVLFVGKNGAVQVHYGYHKFLGLKETPAVTQFYPDKPVGHHKSWLDAIKANKPEAPECRFEYAVQYMEANNVAAATHRAGKKSVVWDTVKGTTDDADVNKFLKPEFREGWNFPVAVEERKRRRNAAEIIRQGRSR